jgi:fimbrial chaperone protein
MIRHARKSSLLLLLLILLGVNLSFADDWQVVPIRVELSARARTDVVTIVNNGDDPLFFEMRTVEWSQDEEGKDKYTETGDLVFFPKNISVPPKNERIVRVGAKSPQTGTEKTYRLFIREIPEPKKKTEGTGVAIAIEFGVPIFVKPSRENPAGTITSSMLPDNQAQCSIRNTGNVHFRIRSIGFTGMNSKGETIFNHDVNGWYLLAGNSRAYSATIPKEICPQLKEIQIQALTDRINIIDKIDVGLNMCSSQ